MVRILDPMLQAFILSVLDDAVEPVEQVARPASPRPLRRDTRWDDRHRLSLRPHYNLAPPDIVDVIRLENMAANGCRR
jgi:hypothetical protein